MRSPALLFLAALSGLAACSGDTKEPASVKEDEARLKAQLDRQAQALQAEAENGTRAIEQALENETANVFENRDALLNEAADNAAAPEQNAAR